MRNRVPKFLAAFLAVIAVLCALAALRFGYGQQPVRRFVDDYIIPAPANLAYAAFVGLLAAAVARRKRVAWWIMLVYFGLQLIADLIDIAIISTIITALFLALLIWARAEFYARTQRGSLWKALAVLVVLGALSFGIGLLFEGRARHAVHGTLGAVTLLAAAYMLFRTQRRAAALHGDDEVRIRRLLNDFGDQDSLGYFATRRDKSVMFAPSGKAAVTYRPIAGVSLASGDPIGEPGSWGPAIEDWLAEAREYGWRAAVMGASEQGAAAYASHGLKVIELGDEAIVHVRDFHLEGRDMRPVRQAVTRIERLGYTVRVRRHENVPAAEMKQAVALAGKWRGNEAERGFSMALSRLDDAWDGRCVLVEALDSRGEAAAMLSLVPWGRAGLSLDLMRRDRQVDNGLMEFMVAGLVREAQRLGVERISLNFAVFRSAFEQGSRIGAGPVSRLWRRILLFLSKWWQLESLYRSNVKYRPEWLPRFLCFGERRELAAIGVAAAIAEGFLVLPGRRGGLTQTPPPGPLPPDLAQAKRPAEERRPEQVRVRLAKLEHLVEPYPVGFPRTHAIASVAEGQRVSVAGRVLLRRDHSGIAFATIRDWSGDIQVIAPSIEVDVGDHIGVTGRVGRSDKGELSVFAQSWTLTAKCLHPLPDKHRGLADPQARVRRRYLDLIVNPSARDMLRVRSSVVRSLRRSLYQDGFIEVETPMLQPVHGGAQARPFVTHINAYDMRLYLRIAPELYLKRLCVGGVEKVFELGRTFRNEGVSFKHNPEFTMLEAYQAYADYEDMRRLAQALLQALPVARADLDLSGDWPVITVYGAISAALGEAVDPDTSPVQLRRLARRAKVPFDPAWGHGEMILELYERLVEHNTTTPTFYKDFPVSVCPLARAHRTDPRLAERWDLVAFGSELGTAYSELIDPIEQRRRLTEQLDEDFLEALEFAMPPTGGLGIGVDRVVMLLTGKAIRETLPFPLVRST